jgi:predicted transposase/invertase (TIGR01784 family)
VQPLFFDEPPNFKHRKNMGIEEIILEAVREESFEKGEQNKSLEIVLRMKKAGFSTADIAKATGLTQTQIKKLS